MKRLLFTALLALTCCAKQPVYPPLPEPTPVPVPVDPAPTPKPTPVDPTPAPTGAVDIEKFTPFVTQSTTLKEVHDAVGNGTDPDGELDDLKTTLWFFYVVRRKDGSAADAALGFNKNPQGTWVLAWKHVGY